MAKPALAPTEAEKQALLALLELGIGWCRTCALVPPIVLSIQRTAVALRTFLAGVEGRTALNAAVVELGAVGSPVLDPAGQTSEGALRALGELRDATLGALGLCTMTPIPEKAFAPYRRRLFLHFETVGSYLAIERCTDAVRIAYDEALRGARETRKHAPSTPSTRARLVARGQILTLLRKRRQRSPEELVLAVRDAGGTLSTTQLARVENGTAGVDVANAPALLAALQVDPAWVDLCLDRACAAAAQFAQRALGIEGDDWFTKVCAVEGGDDAIARAILLSMVAAALWRDSNSSVA